MLDVHEPHSVEQVPYDIFISYARADNATPDGSPGWVEGIRDQLVADFQSLGRPLRVFLDTEGIPSMAHWRRRILMGLRQSRILFVCVSPAYFSSPYCRMEHVEYLARQAQLSVGDESIAAVYFVTVPASFEDAEVEAWKRRLDVAQHVDLREWYPLGTRALTITEVRDSIRALGMTLWDRIELARRGAQIDGNVPPANPYFAGRSVELGVLHDQLVAGRKGSVTLVSGAGGIGKTELLVQYAHAFRFAYPGGVWMAAAEGHESLLPAIASLAADPRLGVLLSDTERNDLDATGRRVADTLRRARNTGGPTLLIVDNVSDPRLLSPAQLAGLDPDSDLVVVASSRLGDSDFPSAHRTMAFQIIDGLVPEDGVALIREHQPPRADGLPDFSSPAEDAAALSIVNELDGYTLSVEQIAVYLGLPGAPSVTEALVELREFGSGALDNAVGAGTPFELSARHQTRVVGRVLDQTLFALGRDDPLALGAVKFAALLPPDAVPWSWLELWLRKSHPQRFADHPFNTSAWATARARLVGRRIITPTDNEALGRMHRVFGELIRESRPLPDGAVTGLVHERLRERDEGNAIAAWEYRVMQGTLEGIDPATADWDATVDAVLAAAVAFVGPAELVTLAGTRYRKARANQPNPTSDARIDDIVNAACTYSRFALETDPLRAADAAEYALNLAREHRAVTSHADTLSAKSLLLALHHVISLPRNDAKSRARAEDLSVEAVELARQMRPSHDDPSEARLLLATALADLSSVRSGQSGWQLEPLALEILTLVGECVQEAPQRHDLRVLLAQAWTRLAHSTGAQSPYAIGGEVRRRRVLRACAILREVLEDEAENLEAANALVWALVNLPVALPPSAHEAAIAATDEAVERARRLTMAFPERLSYLETFDYTLTRSYLALGTDHADAARAVALEHVTVCLRIEEAHPGEPNKSLSTAYALDALREVTVDVEESLRLARDALARRCALPPDSGIPLWNFREQVFAEATVARCAHRASLRTLTDSSWTNVIDSLDRLAKEPKWTVSDLEALLREEALLGWDAPADLREAYADVGRDISWEGYANSLRKLAASSPGGLSEAGRRLIREADRVVADNQARNKEGAAELHSALAHGWFPEMDSLTCPKPQPTNVPTPFDNAVDAARARVERGPADDEARRSLVQALLARAESPDCSAAQASADRSEARTHFGQLIRPSWSERRAMRRRSRA